MRNRAFLALPFVLVAALAATPQSAATSAGVAALQVGLRTHGLYAGAIDGLQGPATAKAIRRFQKRAHIQVDGVVGPQTRKALGSFARHRIGSRPLLLGKKGWDVAALQFKLAWHGFPSGPFDGILGPRTEAALRNFQESKGLKDDGVAGPATLRALRGSPAAIPLSLAWPLTTHVVGDRFGPRGDRFHAGIDLPAATGTPVYAARSGEVIWAGWKEGGWGLLVIVSHGHAERSMYAHLSRIDVRPGVWIGQGVRVGLVGATGDATGPHLHFEVRVHGAAVDPLRVLP